MFKELIALEKDARAYGFDWTNREMIVDQAISECHEILAAISDNEQAERLQEEIGDLIHTAISLCLFAGFDVDETVGVVSKKFAKRMQLLKELTRARGLQDLRGQSMEFMLELWREVKSIEKAL